MVKKFAGENTDPIGKHKTPYLHFSEEEIMTQHNTRDFVENEINPVIEKHFHDGTFPDYLIHPTLLDALTIQITCPYFYT